MDPHFEFQVNQTRRHFFGDSGLKLGGVALAAMGLSNGSVSAEGSSTAVHPALPGLPHFKPTAKSIIYLQRSTSAAVLFPSLSHSPS